MRVKRYNLDVDSDGGWEIGDAYPVAVEAPDGDYVKAEDYDALAARLAEANALLLATRPFVYGLDRIRAIDAAMGESHE